MIEETLEIIDINIKRAESDYKEIKSWNALTPQFFDDDNKRRVIDSFIFRLLKFRT